MEQIEKKDKGKGNNVLFICNQKRNKYFEYIIIKKDNVSEAKIEYNNEGAINLLFEQNTKININNIFEKEDKEH